MHKLIAILLFVLGIFASEQIDILPQATSSEYEVMDLHHEQLLCNHRYNIDAERTSSVVLPVVPTTINNSLRYQQNRTLHIAVVGRSIITSNYLVTRFIHRLGTCARAVDFYLYTLCRLRL
ncbi:MAG: hypothetical protein J6J57_00490 [Alistipes sp.]|nr:hypothetical protein [Alistipes sp.]